LIIFVVSFAGVYVVLVDDGVDWECAYMIIIMLLAL